MNENQAKERLSALDQLQSAQAMIAEGRRELTRAQEKIDKAQALIDASAKILRETWRERAPGEM
ncbi:MAG TPA: hypothetical protein VG713_17520 [Pirellulales bacterium]|nr:hypothetical protein [Pirellulales bacterium]